MAFYKSFLKHIVLPIGDALYGGYYLDNLSKWGKFDKLSEFELSAIQQKKLEDILTHAV